MSKQPLHTVRNLLRLLKTPPLPQELANKQITPPPRLNPCQEYVLKQTRQKEDHPEAAKKTLLLSQNYQRLLQDLAERNRLYALDTGAEEILTAHEISRRAAARVGLKLPEELPEQQVESNK